MRIRLSFITLAVLVAGCAAPAPGDVASSQTASSTPGMTQQASSTASPSAVPSEPIGADDVVATLVNNLQVRAKPGTDQELLGTLDEGEIGLVIADGVQIDGVPWYPLSGLGLPPGTGCEAPPDPVPFGYCGGWRGWVAGASASGDPWLERSRVRNCPADDVDGILSAGAIYRLICFRDEDMTLTAYWPELPPDAGLGGACPDSGTDVEWLLCQNINYNVVTATPKDGFLDGLRLSIDPSSDVVMPERGQWLGVTGHFDDPAAQHCSEATELAIDPIEAVFRCRLEFVATAITPTPEP